MSVTIPTTGFLRLPQVLNIVPISKAAPFGAASFSGLCRQSWGQLEGKALFGSKENEQNTGTALADIITIVHIPAQTDEVAPDEQGVQDFLPLWSAGKLYNACGGIAGRMVEGVGFHGLPPFRRVVFRRTLIDSRGPANP